MFKTLGIVLAVLALLAHVIALAALCHGFLARRQMHRYNRKLGQPAAPGRHR